MRESIAAIGVLVCMVLGSYHLLGMWLMWPSVYLPGIRLMQVVVPGVPPVPTTPGATHVTAHGKFKELGSGQVLVRRRMDAVFRLDVDGVITWGSEGAIIDTRLHPIFVAIFVVFLITMALVIEPVELLMIGAFYVIALPLNLLLYRTLGKKLMVRLLTEYVEGRGYSMARLTSASS